MNSDKPLWLILAPFIFLGLWSGGYVVAKLGVFYADPLTLLALRYACVVAIMAVAFVILKPPLPDKLADWGHLAMVGFLIQTLHFGMVYLALSVGAPAGIVALMLSLQPIFAALIAPSWTGELVSKGQWIGLGLGLTGTATVIIFRTDIGPSPILGLALAAIALCGMTGATLWEKRFGLSHHPVTSNLIGYGAGLITILPFALFLEEMNINWTWEFGLVLFYLVIANSVISVSLLLAMIRVGEVSRVSSLFFLTAPLAAVLAWLSLGEAMPPIAWAGMALAAFGVFIATRAR